MWHNKLPVHHFTFLLTTAACFYLTHAGQLPSLLPSTSITLTHYYHYPAPRRQFTIPASNPTTKQQLQQQLQQQYTSYTGTHQQQQHYVVQLETQGSTYQKPHKQKQQQQQYQQQQQQYQQQQQKYHTHSTPSISTYYHQQQQQPQPAAASHVAKQFTSPALENAAFTKALTSQGYNFGDASAVALAVAAGNNNNNNNNHIRAATTSLSSSARASPAAASAAVSSLSKLAAEAIEAGNNDIATDGSIDLTDSSINLKLPLPVNIAPIKVSPLPLQAGASFSELANGVTSYGTVYPQRKR